METVGALRRSPDAGANARNQKRQQRLEERERARVQQELAPSARIGDAFFADMQFEQQMEENE